jgi:hypothetical protein
VTSSFCVFTVCVYYCSTYYKAVRDGVFITAAPHLLYLSSMAVVVLLLWRLSYTVENCAWGWLFPQRHHDASGAPAKVCCCAAAAGGVRGERRGEAIVCCGHSGRFRGACAGLQLLCHSVAKLTKMLCVCERPSSGGGGRRQASSSRACSSFLMGAICCFTASTVCVCV